MVGTDNMQGDSKATVTTQKAQQILQSYAAYKAGGGQPAPQAPPPKPTPSTSAPISISQATLQKTNALRAEQDLPPLQEVANVRVVEPTHTALVNPASSQPQPEKIRSAPSQIATVLTKQQAQISETQKQINQITSDFAAAKQAGVTSINVKDSSGKVIGTVNPQNVSQARLQFLNLTKQGGVSYDYQTKTTEGTSGVTSMLTTYNPANVVTAFTGGALGGFAELGLIGLGLVAKATGKEIKIPGTNYTAKPTGVLAQAQSKVQQTFGQETIDKLMSGQKVDFSNPIELASLAGFGASLVATGGTGGLKSAAKLGTELINVAKSPGVAKNELNILKSFISKNIPPVPVTAEESLINVGTKLSATKEAIQTEKANLLKLFTPTTAEQASGKVAVSSSSLLKQASTITSKIKTLESQAQVFTQEQQRLTKIASSNPSQVVGTRNVIESIEPLGKGVYGVYFQETKSPFVGAIVSLGEKGKGTFTTILKETPETKPVGSFEVSERVRGIVNKGITRGRSPDQIINAVSKYFKTAPKTFEVTTPKIAGENKAVVQIAGYSEKVLAMAKSLTPKTSTVALGKEISFENISKINKGSPFSFGRELLGERKPNLSEAGKTGDILFMKTNVESASSSLTKVSKLGKTKELVKSQEPTLEQKLSNVSSKVKPSGVAKVKSLFKTSNLKPQRSFTKGKFALEKPKQVPTKEPTVNQREREQVLREQIQKGNELTKPLSLEERRQVLKDLSQRFKQEPKSAGTRYKPTRGYNIPATKQKEEEETVYLTTTKGGTGTKSLTRQISLPDIFPDKTKVKTDITKAKSGTAIIQKTTTLPKQGTTFITTGKTTQVTGQITIPKIPTGGGGTTNIPEKKKTPFGGLPGFTTQSGGLGKVSKGGNRLGYTGNVPLTSIVGTYNRSEISYGKLPKEPKATKQNFKNLSSKGKRSKLL